MSPLVRFLRLQSLRLIVSAFGVGFAVVAWMFYTPRFDEWPERLGPEPDHSGTWVTLFAAIGCFLVVGLMMAVGSVAEVAIDEGGVRYRRGRKSGYVPFAEITEARIAPSMLTLRSDLVLSTKNGVLRLPLGDAAPSLMLESILRHLGRKDASPSAGADFLPPRGASDLASWLGAVREAMRKPTDAYRAHAVDHDALERAFADERVDPSVRAAAAHALLTSGDEATASRVAKAIGPEAPPLVVAAAKMAAPTRIAASVVDEARVYLDARDREALLDDDRDDQRQIERRSAR